MKTRTATERRQEAPDKVVTYATIDGQRIEVHNWGHRLKVAPLGSLLTREPTPLHRAIEALERSSGWRSPAGREGLIVDLLSDDESAHAFLAVNLHAVSMAAMGHKCQCASPERALWHLQQLLWEAA